MDSPVIILLGFAILVYGAIGIAQGRISLGIGGGRGGARPLGTVVLTGIAGRIFSITCLVGGALILFPLLLVRLTAQNMDALVTQISTGVGLAIPIIGFLFACIIQLAMSFGPPSKGDYSPQKGETDEDHRD